MKSFYLFAGSTLVSLVLLAYRAGGVESRPQHWCTYVANAGSKSISVVDGATRSLRAEIALAFSPQQLAVDASRALLYTRGSVHQPNAEAGPHLVAIDLHTFATVRDILLPEDTAGFALSPVGDRAYAVVDFGPDSLVPVDLSDGNLLNPIILGAGLDWYQAHPVISANGMDVYVPVQEQVQHIDIALGSSTVVPSSQTGDEVASAALLNGDGTTLYVLYTLIGCCSSDPALKAIDLLSGDGVSISGIEPLDSGSMALSTDSRTLYVSSYDKLFAVDLATRSVREIQIADASFSNTPAWLRRGPEKIAASPDGTVYLMYNNGPDLSDLLVFDPLSETVVATIPLGQAPTDIVVAEIPGECGPSGYVPPPRATATPVPTMTPRPGCISGMPCLEVTSTTVEQGGESTFEVKLRTAGESIVGIQNDIVVQPPISVTGCTGNGGKTANFGTLTGSSFRALILHGFNELNNFTDGEVLYTCSVRAASDASPFGCYQRPGCRSHRTIC